MKAEAKARQPPRPRSAFHIFAQVWQLSMHVHMCKHAYAHICTHAHLSAFAQRRQRERRSDPNPKA